MARRESSSAIPEASLPYVWNTPDLFCSEMIQELNSVLIPDEEIARINEYTRVMKETKEEREAERAKTQAMLDRMYED